jgi:hypothetical protein
MDAQLRKLADLRIDESYYVLRYKSVSTKFGDTYIIKCRLVTRDKVDDFEMFATKLIASYISTYSPKDKFEFRVRQNAKYTYAEISGYNPTSSFILLN